ncbi:MAG: hypothetical protein NC299_05005 [Lachnospiraceae bacterium]|nr:hypothetical protein [Lachnospiraceae bacterium]
MHAVRARGLPCAALAPFVRCFRTERQTVFERLVIPLCTNGKHRNISGG